MVEQLSAVVLGNNDKNVAVGALTAEHRDTLAVAYQNLVSGKRLKINNLKH